MVDAVYNIPWYKKSSQFRFLIRMMIMRAQKPLGMKVAIMNLISLGTLSSVSKISGIMYSLRIFFF